MVMKCIIQTSNATELATARNGQQSYTYYVHGDTQHTQAAHCSHNAYTLDTSCSAFHIRLNWLSLSLGMHQKSVRVSSPFWHNADIRIVTQMWIFSFSC